MQVKSGTFWGFLEKELVLLLSGAARVHTQDPNPAPEPAAPDMAMYLVKTTGQVRWGALLRGSSQCPLKMNRQPVFRLDTGSKRRRVFLFFTRVPVYVA